MSTSTDLGVDALDPNADDDFDPPAPPDEHDPESVDGLVAAGFDLIPLLPRRKSPRDRGWPTAVYRTEELREWKRSGGNLGARLRKDQLVLDWDPRNDPAGNSLDRFASDVGLDLFTCPITKTPSGGLHVHLRISPDVVAIVAKHTGYPGLDIKMSGGQVLVAGDWHPDYPTGPLYYWLLRGEAPKASPALLEKLRRPERKPRPHGVGAGMTPVRVAQLLQHLDPTTERFADYDGWLRIGMACHQATGGSDEGLDVWTDWSMQDDRGDTVDACEAKWASFNASRTGGVTEATLCREVKLVLGHVPPPPAFEDFDKVPVEAPVSEAVGRRLLTLREFLEQVKPAPPIVDGFLYGSGVFVLFGKWGLGKTYLALDLGLHVAHGLPEWHGRKLHLAGRVVYLALEGEYALPNRIHAWHAYRGRDLDVADIRLFAGRMNLTSPEARESALRMLADTRPALVFADTLSAAMAGADENAAGAVGEVLEWSRRVVRETSAPVVWLHHPGKKESNSARGSSTIEANTDGVLQLSRPSADLDGMLLQARKVRSSAPAHPLRLQLQTVALPGGGSDAVVVLGSAGDERGRRLQALHTAVLAAGGRLSAQQAAEAVARASTKQLDVSSAARWVRETLKQPDSFYLLAREDGGDIVAIPDQGDGDN